MSDSFWEVVGGADKGGILVRTGQELTSPQVPERLSTGAIVRQLTLTGERLEFRRVTGTGPDKGWVSIKLKDKELLKRSEQPVEEANTARTEEAASLSISRAFPCPPSRKVRVLVLHGTASAKEVIKMQLGLLLRKAKNDIEFIMHEGHLVCEESNELVGKQIALMKPYFPKTIFKQYAEPLGEQLAPRTYAQPGMDEALDIIQAALRENAPIDALLGFSQGSNMSHMIAAQAATGRGAPLRCVVHLCSNLPGWMEQRPELFEKPIALPALVISAEKDEVSTGGPEVAASYADAETGSHSDVHRPLPSNVKEAEALAERLMAFLLKHCRE